MRTRIPLLALGLAALLNPPSVQAASMIGGFFVPDACIQAQPSSWYEQIFLESMNVEAQTLSALAGLAGKTGDMCMTTGAGNTYFYHPNDSRTGIRFSIDDFNTIYRISPRPEDALIANLWILNHEFGHALAHYTHILGTLVHLSESPAGRLPLQLYSLAYQTRLYSLLMQTAISQSSFASEAFADCYGGYFVERAMNSLIAQNSELPIRQYLMKEFFASTKNAMIGRVLSVASSVTKIERIHGSTAERVSFVRYGMDVADAYNSAIYNESTRSMTALLLCAKNAFETQNRRIEALQRIPFPVTPFTPFSSQRGY